MLALVGPTASGKTVVSLELGEMLGAEIVCCDSMLVYRGLDVGTAKPTWDARARVPHHMVDVVDPGQDYSVQEFQSQARAVLADLAQREVPALLVGGSGLYVRAALDPLEFPPTNPELRAELEALEPDALRRELMANDRPSAETIDAANVRRMVRAVEVHRLTGRPFSSFRRGWRSFRPVPMAGLCPPPRRHAEAIRQRAQAMLSGGLIDEARTLLRTGASRTASAALGYAEAAEVVEGRLSCPEAAELIAARTRRLARRQRTWFRADPRVAWFGDARPSQLAAYFAAREAPAADRARRIA